MDRANTGTAAPSGTAATDPADACLAHLAHLVCEGKLKQTICGDEYRFELP